MKQTSGESSIAQYMSQDFGKVQVDASLKEVFIEMYEPDKNQIVAVYDQEEVVGILDLDIIYHYLDIRQKLS